MEDRQGKNLSNFVRVYLLDSGFYPRIVYSLALNQAQPLFIMFNLPFPPVIALDRTYQLHATGHSFFEKPKRNLVRNPLAVDRCGDLDEFGRSNSQLAGRKMLQSLKE